MCVTITILDIMKIVLVLLLFTILQITSATTTSMTHLVLLDGIVKSIVLLLMMMMIRLLMYVLILLTMMLLLLLMLLNMTHANGVIVTRVLVYGQHTQVDLGWLRTRTNRVRATTTTTAATINLIRKLGTLVRHYVRTRARAQVALSGARVYVAYRVCPVVATRHFRIVTRLSRVHRWEDYATRCRLLCGCVRAATTAAPDE
jgi:hypothetical protein